MGEYIARLSQHLDIPTHKLIEGYALLQNNKGLRAEVMNYQAAVMNMLTNFGIKTLWGTAPKAVVNTQCFNVIQMEYKKYMAASRGRAQISLKK